MPHRFLLPVAAGRRNVREAPASGGTPVQIHERHVMATRTRRFCGHPGCRALTAERYCPAHAPLHAQREDRRGSAQERGYDADWQRARGRYLLLHPLCERHEAKGGVVPATMVHHIIPIEQGGARLDPENMMALCRDCHEGIHGRKLERESLL